MTDLAVRLRVALARAKYEPGDHPVLPIKIHRFIETVREIAEAAEALSTSSDARVGVKELFGNVDGWGASQWFDRLANAVRAQDKSLLAGDDIGFETHRMIAASSAMTLVREHEQTVRSALAPSSEEREEPRTCPIDECRDPNCGLAGCLRLAPASSGEREDRTAPASCPHCFNEDDCHQVELCRVIEELYPTAPASPEKDEPAAGSCADELVPKLIADLKSRSKWLADRHRVADAILMDRAAKLITTPPPLAEAVAALKARVQGMTVTAVSDGEDEIGFIDGFETARDEVVEMLAKLEPQS